MSKLVVLLLLAVYFITNSDANSPPRLETWVFAGNTAFIPLPVAATYRRLVMNAKGKEIEHLYRVCNIKNKKTCGYWENVNTKKKVASGVTTYNKNKKQLVIKKFRATDAGTYMTGNKKDTFTVWAIYDLVEN